MDGAGPLKTEKETLGFCEERGPISKKKNKKEAKIEERESWKKRRKKKEEDELPMGRSGVAAGNHSGNAVCYGKRSILHSQSRAWQSNFSFFFSLFFLSINFWIGSLSVMSNSFSLSTLGTICGTWRWSEGTRSFTNKPLPPINIVSFSLLFFSLPVP